MKFSLMSLFRFSPSAPYYAEDKDFKRVWSIFEQNKEWFPHVRNTHIENRIKWKQCIIEDNVVITFQPYLQKRLIGKDTDVRVEAGSHLIHQIISGDKRKGKAEKVIKRFFDHVDTNVYLTVRSDNKPANRFYKKIGMKKVGYINWSKGTMKGNVWKWEK
tara:strand:- start:1391 stop:1870 length:480 start_codon:yes stop_codon:yes gene_type:complete